MFVGTEMRASSMLFCYFGHHKCGTGWVRSVIKNICDLAGWKQTSVYDADIASAGQTFSCYLNKEQTDFLCYTNADIDQLRLLNDYRGFHIIRDPRDIVVSAYFSHLHSHLVEGWPDLISHREKLRKMSKDDGLLLEMEFIKPFLDLMKKWDYSNENVLEIKMEQLTAEPEKWFLDIFQFFGLLGGEQASMVEKFVMAVNPMNQRGRGTLPFGVPVSPIRIPIRQISRATIRQAVEDNSFSRLASGRKPGEEDVTSHYRKGKPGDWLNHFNEKHVEYFNSFFENLVDDLGYESKS